MPTFNSQAEKLHAARAAARRVISGLAHGSSGYTYATDTWNEEYLSGRWDYFESLDEMPHYILCAAYAQHIQPNPTILDVGCGYGTLLNYLEIFGFQSYVGIDFSQAAIERVKTGNHENATFEVASFEIWDTSRTFDVIIFCESLYYAVSPVDTLLRYQSMVKENGAFVVSIFEFRNTPKIWQSIESRFQVIHATRVTNLQKQTSDVKILRAK